DCSINLACVQSSLNLWRLKHVRIGGWHQIMLAKRRHRKLARLLRIEVFGFVLPGQFLIVDLTLKFHESVQQRFGPRRTPRNVNVDWNVTVNPFEHIITGFEWSA